MKSATNVSHAALPVFARGVVSFGNSRLAHAIEQAHSNAYRPAGRRVGSMDRSVAVAARPREWKLHRSAAFSERGCPEWLAPRPRIPRGVRVGRRRAFPVARAVGLAGAGTDSSASSQALLSLCDSLLRASMREHQLRVNFGALRSD